MYVFIFLLSLVTEWPSIGKIAAHSAYDMFSWYKYLIVNLVFPISVFGVGIFFLIAPFPDLCLLVNVKQQYIHLCSFCICDTDKSYVHVSRHSISKAVSVQKLIKPISLPWEKKPYHQMIGSHTHVTHIIPREKKP